MNTVNKGLRVKKFGNYRIRHFRRIKLYYSGFRIGLLNTKCFPKLGRSLVKTKSKFLLKYSMKNIKRKFRRKLMEWIFVRRSKLIQLFKFGVVPMRKIKIYVYKILRIHGKICKYKLPIRMLSKRFKNKVPRRKLSRKFKYKVTRLSIPMNLSNFHAKPIYRLKRKLKGYDVKPLLRSKKYCMYAILRFYKIQNREQVPSNPLSNTPDPTTTVMINKYKHFKKIKTISKNRNKLFLNNNMVRKLHISYRYSPHKSIHYNPRKLYYYRRKGRMKYGRFLTIFVQRMKHFAKRLYRKFHYNIRPKIRGKIRGYDN
jgi:hypothetical protein